jgi:hypothetical protein
VTVCAVQVAWVQAFALYGSECWWDPREIGRRDDLQLLLNRQTRSILAALPSAPRGALRRKSGLTPVPVILGSRQQRFAARIDNTCSSKLKGLHKNASSGAPICRAVRKDQEHGRTTEGVNWPAPGEGPLVSNTILDDTTAAKSAAQRWARLEESKIGARVTMWWTDGSRSDNGRVGAAAVCKHGNERRSRHSFLVSGRMEGFYCAMWAIGLALNVAIEKMETL